jgi:hypothetical protein
MIPSETRQLIEDNGQLENVVYDGIAIGSVVRVCRGPASRRYITRVSLNKAPRNKAARFDHLFIRWRKAMNIAGVLSVEEFLLPYGLPKKGFSLFGGVIPAELFSGRNHVQPIQSVVSNRVRRRGYQDDLGGGGTDQLAQRLRDSKCAPGQRNS